MIKYVDVYAFTITPDGLRFLLLRRAADNSYPGIWQPVAGKVKPGEKVWQAALREFSEETGLTALAFYTLDHVSSYYLHPSNELIQVPAFMAEVALKNPALSHEHDAFQWLSLEGAQHLASWQTYRNALSSIPKLLESSPALALAKISLKTD